MADPRSLEGSKILKDGGLIGKAGEQLYYYILRCEILIMSHVSMIGDAIDSLKAKQDAILGEDFDFYRVLGAASHGNSDALFGPLTTFVSFLSASSGAHLPAYF